ncbi:efflux RND transporter periplasmic adaptor subunit [Ensifer sp. HO-A22]|uniref:Efflux RND transporter periplasmic adaptor subunit n=1 Tax=Ensifer oleiphilus TaxID=2742698 RepID=A0A7Y6QAT5_9HYPH|nr:efflux RND transporter periplasmic adaptor subunit [Ensifer oleiphilus]NVD42223.1 efflux RND transporter periplasmic adaptor subunit [Ensifer oleiphilus]
MPLPVQTRLRFARSGRIVFLAAISLVLAACSEEAEEAKPVVRPVKVVEIGDVGQARQMSYSGIVRARTEMNLGFRVNGKITERLVNVGDRVKSGDPLARIDATDYELSVKSAAANLEAAERQVETTALVRARAEQLFARKVASKAQLDQATLGHNQAVATRDAASSALSQAKNQVTYTQLVADRGGIVAAISADVGQVVGSGTPVATVAVDGEKEVLIAVPEVDVANFKPGMAVKAGFWSDQGLMLDGKVREVAGSAEQPSRTFAVRVSLPNDPRVLLGMTATILASADNAERRISVPLSALAQKDGGTTVWVVDRDSQTVKSRMITVADFTGEGVRVVDGLKHGDLVVAAGTQFMTENLKVAISGDVDRQSAAADKTAAAEIVR